MLHKADRTLQNNVWGYSQKKKEKKPLNSLRTKDFTRGNLVELD